MHQRSQFHRMIVLYSASLLFSLHFFGCPSSLNCIRIHCLFYWSEFLLLLFDHPSLIEFNRMMFTVYMCPDCVTMNSYCRFSFGSLSNILHMGWMHNSISSINVIWSRVLHSSHMMMRFPFIIIFDFSFPWIWILAKPAPSLTSSPLILCCSSF